MFEFTRTIYSNSESFLKKKNKTCYCRLIITDLINILAIEMSIGTNNLEISPTGTSWKLYVFQSYGRTTERKEDVLYYTFEQDKIQQIVNLFWSTTKLKKAFSPSIQE